MTFAKFQGNLFKIDRSWLIIFNLAASIAVLEILFIILIAKDIFIYRDIPVF